MGQALIKTCPERLKAYSRFGNTQTRVTFDVKGLRSAVNTSFYSIVTFIKVLTPSVKALTKLVGCG